MNTPANRRLVIARNYSQFKHYVDQEADPKLIHIYVSSASVLAGRTFAQEQLVWLSGWEAHHDAKSILSRVAFQAAFDKPGA